MSVAVNRYPSCETVSTIVCASGIDQSRAFFFFNIYFSGGDFYVIQVVWI